MGLHVRLRGSAVAFELHKFGLWLLAPERHPFESALTREVISRMKKAIAVLEELLEDVAEHQAAEGNVTIANMYPSLDRRYRFFRELAKEAYASPVPAPVVVEESPDGSMRHLRHDFMKPEREGFHFTGAMIDAYFSRLEHLLILVLPFIGFDPTQKRLLAFLDAPLSEKLKRVLDLADPPTKNTYDEFLRLRDLVRNPLAHGGIERGGRSVFFHVPMIGALPARMTAARDAVHHFRFTPLPEARYAECCKLFDALDAILEKPPTSSGVTWAGSGFDVAFDEESRAEFAAAMRSEGGLAKMIEDVSEEIAYHINMDY